MDVDSFNIELKDDDGFLGDRASKGAFRKILDTLRKPLKKNGDDPFGNKSAESISKNALDEALVGDDIGAAALVHGAIEEFAQELAYVTGRFLKTKAWADTERIVVGGGFRGRAGSANWRSRAPTSCSKPKGSRSIWCRSAFIPMKPA